MATNGSAWADAVVSRGGARPCCAAVRRGDRRGAARRPAHDRPGRSFAAALLALATHAAAGVAAGRGGRGRGRSRPRRACRSRCSTLLTVGRRRSRCWSSLYRLGRRGAALAGGRRWRLPFLALALADPGPRRRDAGGRGPAGRAALPGGGLRRRRPGGRAARGAEHTAAREAIAGTPARAHRPRRAGPDRPRAARRGRAPHLDDRGAGRDRPADHARACRRPGAQRLSAIGDTARAALTEMRRLLGVLREDAGDRRPPTGSRSQACDQLNELLDEARDATGAGTRLIVQRRAGRARPGRRAGRLPHRPGGAHQRPAARARRRRRRRAALQRRRRCGCGSATTARGRRPAAAGPAGTGCSGMRERAAAVGGELRTGAGHRRRLPGRGHAARQGGRDDDRCAGPIRIVVADDHQVVRDRLRRAARHPAGLHRRRHRRATAPRRCGSAASCAPDVVLMDVRMPGMDGIEATRQLAGAGRRGPRILILTTFDLDEYVYDALARRAPAASCSRTSPPSGSSRPSGSSPPARRCSRPAVTRRLISEFARLRPRADGRRRPAALAALTPRETRGAAAGRRGPVQPGDRRPARRHRGDRQDARQPRADQARACATARRPSSPPTSRAWSFPARGPGPQAVGFLKVV